MTSSLLALAASLRALDVAGLEESDSSVNLLHETALAAGRGLRADTIHTGLLATLFALRHEITSSC